MRQLLIPLIILMSFHSAANDKLAELTLGNVWTKYEKFIEMGLDMEYFPERSLHRYSFGLATEVEFEKEKEFYGGPLLSVYLNQVKFFFTSGLQGHDSHWRMKSRLGIGYDFHLPDNYLMIPNLTADFIDREVHPGVSIGLAKLF